jgi:hypothetical protein
MLPSKSVGSVASLQSWKKATKGKRSGKKKKSKSSKKIAAADAECTCECCNGVLFEEFVQTYWTKSSTANEVLKLPPDMMPEAVKYVNNVLKYAYDQLCAK